jgi:hypothetical protein
MEAASRPPLELLHDLPVEEPLDMPAAPPAPPPAAVARGAVPAPGAAPANTGQTGLNFLDPELFLAAGQTPTAVPVAAAAAAPPDPATATVLEDPVVDDLLTTAPAPQAPVAAVSSSPAAPSPSTVPEAPASTVPASSKPGAAPAHAVAHVPIARTPSLTAAAAKLAAAKAATQKPAAKPSSPAPKPAAVLRPSPLKAPASSSGSAPAAGVVPLTSSRTLSQPGKPQGPTESGLPATGAATKGAATPKIEAPSLASWASARAAAAPKANATGAATPTASAAMGAGVAARKGPTAPPAPAAVAAIPPAPPIDRDFIARNQVVERYLSGRLPLKGATEFERFCHEHPELLDEIGLPERVNAGLRLLEASGKPEPWQEPSRPAWQKPQVTLALGAAAGVLALALAIVAGGSASKSQRIAELSKQAAERALDPATSRREIRLLPSRSGASNSPAITIGGSAGGAQLADFKIDESRSPYHAFRITIDRIDQGRVAIINNLAKDSNGHLRIALNSSALGPGNYQLTLEGLDWRGEPQPDSWITIGIVR